VRVHFLFIIFLTLLAGQTSFTGSIETRIGESRNATYYNESLINTQILFNHYLSWIQYEFSDPPELGRKINGIRKLRLEYKKGPIQVKLGDLYEIWGRGLILNSVDDQSIDRDSGIRGVGIMYKTDLFNIQFLTGRSELSSTTIYSPGYNTRVPNYTTVHNLYGINSEIVKGKQVVGFTFLQSKEFHPVNTFPVDTLDIKNRFIGGHYILNQSLVDMYFEYIKNWSTQLIPDQERYKNHKDGRGFYGNINFYFPLFSFNMEYINYRFGTLDPANRWNNVDNYGMAQDFQNPPIATRIHETTLLNRISHQTDFNNEVGYKFEVISSLSDRFEFLGSYSRSSRSNMWYINEDYLWEKEGKPTIFPLTDPAATPYQSLYGEMTGYFFDYAMDIKIGYAASEDKIDLSYYTKTDISKNLYYTYQSGQTIPFHIGYTFKSGWSLDVKFESQLLKKGIWKYEELNGTVIADSLSSEFLDDDGNPVDSQKNVFLSIGIGKTPKWTVAFTLDRSSISESTFSSNQEVSPNSSNSLEDLLGLDKRKNWVNIEFVYNVTTSLRVSLMYGSLKGGLLCANGICRLIEPFNNGVKLGITSVF